MEEERDEAGGGQRDGGVGWGGRDGVRGDGGREGEMT